MVVTLDVNNFDCTKMPRNYRIPFEKLDGPGYSQTQTKTNGEGASMRALCSWNVLTVMQMRVLSVLRQWLNQQHNYSRGIRK